MISKHSELYFTCSLILILASMPVFAKPWDHGRLVVNTDEKGNESSGHLLRHEDGTPFFWMGDTAWGIFRNSFWDANPAQGQPFPLSDYFAVRAGQGFNVVETQLLPFTDNTDSITSVTDANTNAYGQMAFIGGNTRGDFSQPAIRPNKSSKDINDYWDYVDRVIDMAAEYAMYVSIVPAWNNHLPEQNPPSVVTDISVAYKYGRFLGMRYGAKPNIIWMLGGDAYTLQDKINTTFRKQLRRMNSAMAEGIADGTNGINNWNGIADYTTTLMTLHPKGGRSSKELEYYRQAAWMDFDAIQTSQGADRLSDSGGLPTYKTVSRDYNLLPLRPTLESEVSYEYALRSFSNPPKDIDTIPITSWEARRSGYLSVFAGSLGYTYGNINLIHFLRTGQTAHIGSANGTWFESMGVDLNSENCPVDFKSCQITNGTKSGEAANSMMYLRNLIESRFTLDSEGRLSQDRVPDQSMIVEPKQRDLNRYSQIQATRSSARSYIMVYTSNGGDFSIDMSKLAAREFNAWWFNPRDGYVYGQSEGEAPGADQPFLNCVTNEGKIMRFTPPGKPSPSASPIINMMLKAIGLDNNKIRDNSIGNDWVLVLDDANTSFVIPGRPETTPSPKCDGTDAVETLNNQTQSGL